MLVILEQHPFVFGATAAKGGSTVSYNVISPQQLSDCIICSVIVDQLRSSLESLNNDKTITSNQDEYLRWRLRYNLVTQPDDHVQD